MTQYKPIRVRKNRYTARCCARCGNLIGHLRLMASHGADAWTCMPCEWLRREQLRQLMETPPRPSERGTDERNQAP